MQEKDINHRGRIISIDTQNIIVEIISHSACSSCSASKLCSSSEAVKKKIVVPADVNGNYFVGQEVDVCLKQSMGMKAVLISYVIPLFILMILIVSLSYTKINELSAGLMGIGAVAVYYFIIFLFRKRIEKDYNFYIKG